MITYQDIQTTLIAFDDYKKTKLWYWVVGQDDPVIAQLSAAFPLAAESPLDNRPLTAQETLKLGKVLFAFNKVYTDFYSWLMLILKTNSIFYQAAAVMLYDVKMITLMLKLRKKFSGALLWDLEVLQEHDCLEEPFVHLLLTNDDFSKVMYFARKALNQKIIQDIAAYPDLNTLNSCIYVLWAHSLLTKDNMEALLTCPAPLFLAVFHSLPGCLLTQELFNKALPYSRILANSRIYTAILNLPDHIYIHSDQLTHIFTLCSQYADNYLQAVEALIAYLNEIVETNFITLFNRERGIQKPAVNNIINTRQSTHTASVHISASQSALRLYEEYKAQLFPLQIPILIKQLCNWVISLPSTDFKIKKAQVAARNILAQHSLYNYVDKTSHLSNRQLLCLAWIAIHDDKLRVGNLEDAKQNLVEGLYEIQRQNNISVDGVDNGLGQDNNCCPPGVFNKILEKLQSVHPLVHIDFVSKTTCTFKLRALVREEVKRLLEAHSKNDSEPQQKAFYQLLKQMEKKGCKAIWNTIHEAIRNAFKDEFIKYFRNEEELNISVNEGQYVNCKDLIEPYLNKFLEMYSAQQLENFGMFSKSKKTKLPTLPTPNPQYPSSP